MNFRLKKQAESLAALSPEDLARLERLAELAKLTPEEIWPEVLKYGFDDVEESVQADLEAEEYFKINSGIDHAEVMEKAQALIAAYGKPERKTG